MADYDVFDRTLGILVVLFGATHLLGAMEILSPALVSVILPVLIILGGLKITLKDIIAK